MSENVVHVVFSVSSSLSALLVNLDVSFAYSFQFTVFPVLWKVVSPCQHIPNTQYLSLTRTHQYGSLTRPTLQRQLGSSGVLLAFVVSKCCQLSPLSPGLWLSIYHVHPQCASCSCCLSLCLLILLLILTLPLFLLFLLLLHLALFSGTVMSFIHSSHLLFSPLFLFSV